MIRLKDKEGILKATREKQIVIYKGTLIRLPSDFSREIFQARRQWCEIFKVMKSKDLKPRLLYPARLSYKIKGEIRSFPDKKKLKEVVSTKPVVQQQMLKGLEEKRKKKERKKKEERRKKKKEEEEREGEGSGRGRKKPRREQFNNKWHYICIYQYSP